MMVYIGNTGHIKKNWNYPKFQNFILVQTDVPDFSGLFYEQKGRKLGNLEWDDLGISSETTIQGISSETAAPCSLRGNGWGFQAGYWASRLRDRRRRIEYRSMMRHDSSLGFSPPSIQVGFLRSFFWPTENHSKNRSRNHFSPFSQNTHGFFPDFP